MQDNQILIPYKNIHLSCIINRTKNRKNIAISVKPDGTIIVHAPLKTSLKTLQSVVRDNTIWILNKYEHAQRIYADNQSTYKNGDTVLYLGQKYTICYTTHISTDVQIQDKNIYVYATDTVSCRLAILAFYRKQAKKIFTQQTAYWIPKVVGASPQTKLTVKSMTTRWGSMSSTGNMSLNIALIRTPIACIDYVIVHELCHQDHPHHQKSFWDAVAVIMPDYKQYKNALKNYPTEY